MTANFSTPILGSSLPHAFRKIRLELARERVHPDGDIRIGYLLIALGMMFLETWLVYPIPSRPWDKRRPATFQYEDVELSALM